MQSKLQYETVECNYGAGADGESCDVGDWSDGDGHSGVFQRTGHPLRNRASFLLFRQIIQSL